MSVCGVGVIRWSAVTATAAAAAAVDVPTRTVRRGACHRLGAEDTGVSLICSARRLPSSARNSWLGASSPGRLARNSIAVRICAASKSSGRKDLGRRPRSRSST
ncbi:Uncharacterised protein [Mycobacteroides abscessus subsp. abscessus]|nr:Uncharacterised protein [Mycobacteroides abscessus subsp. abscessus]